MPKAKTKVVTTGWNTGWMYDSPDGRLRVYQTEEEFVLFDKLPTARPQVRLGRCDDFFETPEGAYLEVGSEEFYAEMKQLVDEPSTYDYYFIES